MAYCRNCGAQIEANANHCQYCGAAQSNSVPVNNSYQGQPRYNNQGAQLVVVDNGGPLWFMLGFCFPLIGLIMFLIYSGNKPNTAKSVGTGALVSVILGVVFYVFAFLIAGIAGA